MQKQISDVKSWDNYWQVGTGNAAHVMADVQREQLKSFWKKCFNSLVKTRKPLTILEIACGNGDVTKQLVEQIPASRRDSIQVFALDYSKSAVHALDRHFLTDRSMLKVVSADAKSLPFADQSFDLVISQFGVEYAGLQAFEEVHRVLKNTGRFAAVIHQSSGAIYFESQANLKIIQQISECQLVTKAKHAFDMAYKSNHSSASKAAFQKADQDLSLAVNAAKSILNRKEQSSAHLQVLNIYRNIAHMYQNMDNYRPTDVSEWFVRTENELNAYAGRMSSMLQSAKTRAQIKEIMMPYLATEEKVQQPSALRIANHSDSFAWTIDLRK